MADETTEPAAPAGLAAHLRDALVAAHGQVSDAINAAKLSHTTNVLERFEADIAPMLAPIVAEALANPGMPDQLRELVGQVGQPEHFSSSLLIGVAVGAIIGPVLGSAVEPYVQNISNASWEVNPSRPLTPDLLASAVLKAVLQESQAATVAAQSGISGPHFHTMVETAGQSIGLEGALLLYRRGLIPLSSADPANPGLAQVLQYSDVNPRFYHLAELLKYVPLSSGEVVAANLKGHLPDADAVRLLQETGIDGAAQITPQYNAQQLLRASAGRPPGIEQMLELRNRSNAGLTSTPVTDNDVADAVRQSDINDRFLPFVMELGHYFPPPRSIVPMLRAHAISETQARQLLTAYGVREPWASAFIAEAHTTKTGAVKELGQAQITALYEARMIGKDAAAVRIEALGYSPADATALLDLADEKRTVALQNAAIRRIGSEYVSRKITLAEATSALGAAAVPTAAQHDLVTFWDVERSVNVHRPSPAQVVGAFRRGELTAAECKLRLQQLGVADADLGIFVADGYPPSKAAEAQREAAAVVSA